MTLHGKHWKISVIDNMDFDRHQKLFILMGVSLVLISKVVFHFLQVADVP